MRKILYTLVYVAFNLLTFFGILLIVDFLIDFDFKKVLMYYVIYSWLINSYLKVSIELDLFNFLVARKKIKDVIEKE